MANRKERKKQQARARRYDRSPRDLLLAKLKKLRSALETFENRQRQLRLDFNETGGRLGEQPLPDSISTYVWMCSDGILLARYAEWRGSARFEGAINNGPLASLWSTSPAVPTEQGPFPIAALAGVESCLLMNCTFNDHSVKYISLSRLGYDDPQWRVPEHTAILDFRLTALGMYFSSLPQPIETDTDHAPCNRVEAIHHLERLIGAFGTLLDLEGREEDLQQFLRDNPILLGPATRIIPKQKLGEDFVTDFVLLNQTEQGNEYTLVEIERSSHRLFTQAGDRTADLSHADKQTLEWQVWLEKNQGYIRNKLPGFESPRFRIIIGRSHDLTEQDKAILRAMNRRSSNCRIDTYDDVLAQSREMLGSLQALVEHPRAIASS